jgi:protein arginine kinase activator
MKNRLCELCHYRDATLSFAKSVNNVRQEIHLCADCAALEGLTGASAEDDEQWGDGLFDPFDNDSSEFSGETSAIDVRCPQCDTSRQEFERTGLLGCAVCYESFAEDLDVLMRRLHGATQHLGRRPRPRRVFGASGDEAALLQELQRAIDDERFERAAELRDLLRSGPAPAPPPNLPLEAERSPFPSSSQNAGEETSGNDQ